MCGLSGYIGSFSDENRLKMVVHLAKGIDRRGGDACGYLSISPSSFNFSRKVGPWLKSNVRFVHRAAEGDRCMMHARYKTCGQNVANSAHPFPIRRNGKIVLWGAHNGMISNAWDSAKNNKRSIDVDSQEIFELLADKDYEGLRKLNGYGVITWIEAENPSVIKMVRLSSHSDICAANFKTGGMAWASTWDILSTAINETDLEIDGCYKLEEIGRVYEFTATGALWTRQEGIKVGSSWSSTTTTHNYPGRSLSSFGSAADPEDMAAFAYGYGGNYSGNRTTYHGSTGSSSSSSSSSSASDTSDKTKIWSAFKADSDRPYQVWSIHRCHGSYLTEQAAELRIEEVKETLGVDAEVIYDEDLDPEKQWDKMKVAPKLDGETTTSTPSSAIDSQTVISNDPASRETIPSGFTASSIASRVLN